MEISEHFKRVEEAEISPKLIGYVLAIILCCFAIYEAVNWIGVPDQAVTHGYIARVYFEPRHTQPYIIGKMIGVITIPARWHELIRTPEGDDWWTLENKQDWEQKGVCVRVLYHRSRLSHDFSASEIWREDCDSQK